MSSLLALASALTYGTADFLGGLATRKAGVWTVVLWSHLVGLGMALVAAPFLGGRLDGSIAASGAVAGLSGTIGLLALYSGLAAGRMAVVAPVSAVVAAALPVLVGVGVGERPASSTWIGIALALPAIGLVSAGGSLRGAGLGNGLLAGAGFAGFFLALATTTEADGLWALVPARGASILMLLVVLSARRSPLGPPARGLGLIAAVGAGDMLANIFYLLAVQRGLLTSTVVLTSLYPAVTVLLARSVLHESILSRQWLGLAMAVAAVALIAL